MNPHAAHPVSLSALVDSVWRNRQLIAQMTKREVVGRYRGSVLGIAWSLLNPMLLLAVYTFVFSVVFKARWNTGHESKMEFAIVLFAGLIVFGLFSECINRAPGLILANPNYVKKMVFPLEIMPFVLLGVSTFHAVISFFVLLLVYFLTHHMLHWTAIFLPVVLMPLVLIALGLSWFLASLGVFLRDLGHAILLLTTVLMFSSPVFYPITSLPEAFRKWLSLSPLAIAIEQTRDVIIWGVTPDWRSLGVMTFVCFVFAWLGFIWFQKTRRDFSDVI